LPSVLGTGGIEYTLLAPFTAVLAALRAGRDRAGRPDLGVAYGQFHEPLRVPTGYRLHLRLVVRPSVPCWDEVRRFALPPGMQRQGWFLPRRYHVERRIAWEWLSRVDGKGES
jgi:hypothetical protein